MKHFAVFLSIAFIFCSASIYAQKNTQHFKGTEAARYYKGASQVFVNNQRNTISFVRLSADASVSESRSLDWLRTDILKARDEDQFTQYQKFNDKIGFNHTRYRQYYKGVPVEYGVYYIHNRDGKVQSANGEWYSNINISTKPKLSASQSYQAACGYMGAISWYHEREEADNNKLMILPNDGMYILVYKCDVYAQQPLKREWVYVNAQDGSIVKSISRINEIDVPGTATTTYSGTKSIACDSVSPTSFYLREYSTREPSIETYNGTAGTWCTNTSSTWTSGSGFDSYCLDVHYGSEATYDYYAAKGWLSIDGTATFKMQGIAHSGCCDNAFWDGTYASFLDGSGDHLPLTSLEVVGHEFTHGVTEHSSGLVYSCESGSMNESFSDIFGVTIRFLNTTIGTWYLGDQFNWIIRNMANPNDFSNPDCYDGDFWSSCPEVHSGSGVGNYWYYLLTEGGAGVNDVGNSFYVAGLGLADAGEIAFRTNTVYLTPNSPYSDLYDYSVQSAKDLFGECSSQTVQTASAGYAVNIGLPFQDAVTAIFGADQNQFCTLPGTVNFTNSSLNGTDYLWDFGDGSTSTDFAPSHTYTTAGTYTVTLITDGISPCNTTDTMIKTSYINVQNIGQPITPACVPNVTAIGPKFGIFNFTFGDINNNSGGADEGYKDFSCSAFTQLTAGDPYYAYIKLGSKTEDVKMWIDYNNDGIFDNASELIDSVDGGAGIVTFLVHTPTSAILNTPLRVRLIDDKKSSFISDACFAPTNGQSEDYSIYFVSPGAESPAANFTSDVTTVNLGGIVNFSDLSLNSPTSWSWTFNSGTPANSTAQYPTNIQYNSPGVFDVSLTATNAFGSGSVTKTAYITVNPIVTMCSFDTATLDAGTLYDSGGPSSNYGNDENCTFLIKPACAKSITLTFSQFSSQGAGDVLNVYDGADATAPLILTASGNPFPLPSVTGTNGALFITWNSDAGGIGTGYSASWSDVPGGTVIPVPVFTVSDLNPPYGITVNFTDQSTNIPIYWSWDFGDGQTSTLQNPSHLYANSGTYTVTLTASNCGGSASTTQTVIVQPAPAMGVEPTEVTVNLGCGVESSTIELTVSNHGAGDLVYDLGEWEYSNQGSKPNILALTYGTDLTTYNNTIAAITDYFPDYTLTTTDAQTAEELEAALLGKNVFLMTKPNGDPSVYFNYAAVLQTFVDNGGSVIICGAATGNAPCIFNTGMLSGTYVAKATNQLLDVLNTTDPITVGLPSAITKAPKNTFVYDITNSDFTTLIQYTGNDVVGYRNVGLGHVVFIGFDYQNLNDTSSLVIGNTMSWINSMLIPDFVTISPVGGGIVDPASSAIYSITVDGEGMPEGTYYEYFVITGNDPINPIDTVWLTINVQGEECSNVAADINCGGNVCFTDSINGGVQSVSYDFGDGSNTTSDNPCHTYSSAGSYNVTTILCGGTGCDTLYTVVNIVFVNANITYSGVLVTSSPINFFANSSGAISWSWDFGDGSTSTVQNPTHSYNAPGIYTVTLTVTDANGCTFSTTSTLVILAVGIGETNSGFDVSVFPNPANNLSNISYTLPQSSSVMIEVWNGIAQKVSVVVTNQVQKAGNYTYPIRLNEAGLYYVKMVVDDRTIWMKLVNQK